MQKSEAFVRTWNAELRGLDLLYALTVRLPFFIMLALNLTTNTSSAAFAPAAGSELVFTAHPEIVGPFVAWSLA
jgi:hypothetical protein